MKDYYAILGLPYTASAAEIDAAFRSLAKKHHPDLHPQDEQSLELFKLATEAHEVLSDAAKRRDYDLARRRRRASQSEEVLPPRSSGPTSRQRPPTESLDLEARLPLVPEEARWGGAIDLKLTYSIACPHCAPSTQPDCLVCGGKGTQLESQALTLRLPPGLGDGEVLRVPGRGRSAGKGGARGDLRLVVEVRPCW